MKTKQAQRWYEAKTGSHQGLIIDETTGENIAVTYDKANAPLVASAQDLLEAAKVLDLHMMKGGEMHQGHPFHVALRAAIAKAEGGK